MAPIRADEMDRPVKAMRHKVARDPFEEGDVLGGVHFAARHRKFAMLNLAMPASMAVDGHVIRRVGEDHLRLGTSHQRGEGLWPRSVPAEHAVTATLPQIVGAADRWRRLIDCRHLVGGSAPPANPESSRSISAVSKPIAPRSKSSSNSLKYCSSSAS